MFMNDDHPSFLDKPNPEDRVWRYMDLARYMSLLEEKALHFSSPQQMRDRWEGSYSTVNQALRPQLYGEDFEGMSTALSSLRHYGLQRFHMNCWHLADYESAAMWDIYQREGRGVAIRSTWGALTSSVNTERKIYGARVKYVDYSKTFIPERFAFDSFMHKRQSFSHEREVRLMMMTGLTKANPTPPPTTIDLGPEPSTIPILVNMPELIHEVFVAPNEPQWFADLVLKITKRYGYDFPVRKSDLASDPID